MEKIRKHGILDAEELFNEDGRVNSDTVSLISATYKKDAEQNRDYAGEQIKQNLQRFMDNTRRCIKCC